MGITEEKRSGDSPAHSDSLPPQTMRNRGMPDCLPFFFGVLSHGFAFMGCGVSMSVVRNTLKVTDGLLRPSK